MTTQYVFGIKLAVEGEQEVVAATGKAAQGFTDLGTRADRVGDVAESASKSVKTLGTGLRDMADDTLLATRRSDGLADGIGFVVKAAAGFYVVQQFAGTVGSLAESMLDAQVKAEKLQIGLKFGFAGQAAGELDYLRSTTQRLGLEFGTTSTAYIKFAVAAKDTALEGAAARTVFESVAKASTVMGLSADETSGVMLALSQMISKGTVQSEELRGQLGERLPGAFQIAARSMGVTTQELGKMLEQGQVISEDFLPKFAQQLERELGDSVETAAQRTEASTNRMTNAWMEFKQAVASSGVAEAIRSTMDSTTGYLKAVTDAMTDAKSSGSGFFGQIVAGVGALSSHAEGVRAFGGSFGDVGKMMNEAQAQLVKMQAQAEIQPTNIYLKQSIVDLQAYIAKVGEAALAEAKRRAAQAGQTNESLAETNRLNAAAAEAGQAAAARTKLENALEAQMLKLSGVSKDYVPQVHLLREGYNANLISADQYAKGVAQLTATSVKDTDAQRAANKARDEATAAAKKAKDEHDRLINSYVDLADKAQRKSDATLFEADSQVKLTDTQKDYIKVFADVRDGKVKYTDLVKAGVIEDLQAAMANDQLASALAKVSKETAAASKATAEAEKANMAFTLSTEKTNAKLEDEINKLAASNDVLRGNKGASAENTAEKYLAAAASAERAAMVALERNEDVGQYEALMRQAGAYRELASLKADEVPLKIARDARIEWDKTADSISKGLTDSLFRAFESGKDFFSVLWDGVVNTFKVTILKPIIEDTTKQFLGWFKQTVFGIESSPINPSFSTGGLQSWLTAFGDGLNTILSWFGTSWQSLFNGFSSGLGSLVSGVGSLLGSDTLGSAGTWLSGLNAASGATGGAGGGLGSLGTIGGALTKLFGGGSAAGGAGTVAGGGGITLGGVTGSVGGGTGAGVISGGTGLSGGGSTIGSGIGSSIGGTGVGAGLSGTAGAGWTGGVGAAGSGGAGLGAAGSLAVVGAAYLLGDYLQSKDNGFRITGFAATDLNYNRETMSPGLDTNDLITPLAAKNVYLMDQRGPQDAAAQAILDAVASQYQTLATAFGGKPGSLTGAVAIELNPTSPDKDNVFALDAKLNGVDIYSRNNRKSGGGTVDDFGDSTAELERVVQLASSQAVLRALQATDLGADVNAQIASIGFGDAIGIQEQLTAILKARGVPGYANGGMHSGGWRVVGERGYELEATGPARYFNHQQTQDILSGGGSGLVEELRMLRAEMAQLRAEAADRGRELVKKAGETADALTGATRGGLPLLTQAAP